jgi:hypothetical protein
MSAAMSARSVRQAEGLDPVRALQRVLYRSAKHDPGRRFHALFDKVARSDVMVRAWNDVAANHGALPGCARLTVNGVGEPCAGEPHARFDGRGLDTEQPGHGHRSGTACRETAGTPRLRDLPPGIATDPALDPTVE